MQGSLSQLIEQPMQWDASCLPYLLLHDTLPYNKTHYSLTGSTEVWAQHSWVLYLGLSRLKSMCWPSCILIWSSGHLTKLIQVVGRVQFLVVVGLRSLLSCWLLARTCSQLLEATLSSQPHSPLKTWQRTFSKLAGESFLTLLGKNLREGDVFS